MKYAPLEPGYKPKPTSVHLCDTEISSLCDRIAEQSPDGVIFEGVCLLEAIRVVRKRFPKLRIIVDFHNVESERYKEDRMSKFSKVLRPIVRWYYRSAIKQAHEADFEVDRLVDEIWCCSEADKQLARQIGLVSPIHVIPNPVPSWCFETVIERSEQQTDLLYLGHLGYRPNVFAVERLCRDIMPRIHKQVPEMRLHVAGRSPSRRVVSATTSSGAKLTADPETLEGIYATAAIMAIPLTEGGGTRIKVLEAMAIGCPIVATNKAVEGLDLVPGKHFVHAETASEFADAIIQLSRDPNLSQLISDEARRYCHMKYSNENRAKMVREALEKNN